MDELYLRTKIAAQEVLKDFIVFEGLDGAGKTTQLELLENYCRANNIHIHATREPTDGLTGRLLRAVLSAKVSMSGEELALNFAVDRAEHINAYQGIIENLKSNKKVICDRYLFSSLVYQGLELDFMKVFRYNEDFPLPEFLIFLDLDANIGHARLQERQQVQHLENEIFEDLASQRKIRSRYQDLFNLYKSAQSTMKILLVDASRDVHRIHTDIVRFIFDKT